MLENQVEKTMVHAMEAEVISISHEKNTWRVYS